MQAAYDRGDVALLPDVMTFAMPAQIGEDLASRAVRVSTDVVTLDADLLDVQAEGAQYVAGVRFHGSLREDGAAMPAGARRGVEPREAGRWLIGPAARGDPAVRMIPLHGCSRRWCREWP
ncbi:MAG: hypothetical protein KGL70_08955 [Betaproteobacteria bacterium]|nr:hypothetical protein [Betaproteobacteria bacterium]MDE2359499.1 hypothetical protein [Betaproteobacteria bacterium]